MFDTQIKDCERLFEDFKNAVAINNENLETIISDNKDTPFGKRMGFCDIHSATEYKEKVSLSEYEDYADITTPENYTAYPVENMLGTSGSTGKQKIFPLTAEALKRYSTYVHSMPYYLTNVKGKIIHTSVFCPPKDGRTILSAAYFSYLAKTDSIDFSQFLGGKALHFSDEINDVPYVKAWLMLGCAELEAIQAIYLYDVAMIIGWLEKNADMLISDMKNARVSAPLPDNIKSELLKNLPSRERIAEVEEILKNGLYDGVMKKLWKNLKFICGVGGKAYKLQEEQLKRYSGNLPIYQFSYALSECIIAPAIGFGKAYYALLPRSAFYEFISKDGKEVLPLCEIKKGETYELVITTFSGLYRYRTGDFIKICDFKDQSPVFEMVGKRRQILDIAGEKLDGYSATEAVNLWAKNYSLETTDFGMSIDATIAPNGYRVFVETEKEFDKTEAAKEFDGVLKGYSKDYRELRDLGLIAMPKIYPVRRGEILESHTVTGKMAHSKPQIFLNETRVKYLLAKSESYGK